MADRVTIVCADGLRINYSTEYYKTLSDVSQLGNEVPIPFDGDLVSRVISYRRGYVPSVGEALQALEVLHYLQADSKIIVERYGSPYYIDMRRLLKCCLDRVMHRILECCLDSVTGPLHDDLLTQEDHHISVKLKDKLVELVGEGAMKMLQRRYEPDPVIAAAEQVVGTKMIDLLFCYFVFHAE